jgi:glucose-6-phosphate 1-dehydrogenase
MSFDLVLFGGTGDLTWRKLIPALFQAYRHNSLSDNGRIIGVGRENLTAGQYRDRIKQRFQSVEMTKRPSDQEFEKFSQLLDYVRVDLSCEAQYEHLAQNLKTSAADTIVLYLATAPTLFTTIIEQISSVGLNGVNTRIVLEKPLGYDLASNKEINSVVRAAFSENQIFRIDHYLGKPAVQNLFALRFGNALFEPLWRREHISNIQITIAESIGVEKRGGFYDGTGALRDMVQNHALQLLCVIAMEPPISLEADAIRDEKLKVLRSLTPWTAQNLATDAIRGQYTDGNGPDGAIKGYRKEIGVNPDSTTETFVALRTEIKNWRWAGVPFYIRTGKRMAKSCASIVVNFRPIPHAIFNTQSREPNSLVINLQPKDGLALHLLAQGQTQSRNNQNLSPVQLDLDFNHRFGSERVGAYEHLLLDVLSDRLNLFVRSDEQEEAWRWVEPLMADWNSNPNGLRMYTSGSYGPSTASALIARDGYCWDEER